MKKIISLLFVPVVLCFAMVASFKAYAAEYKQALTYHILVADEEQANELKKEINAGENRAQVFNNFTAAAKKYSKCPSGLDGGKLGWIGKGEMVKPFEDAVFAMPDGQDSDPVKTTYGWHLIYVVSKK
ncbi:MAG: peptidyl-prolyl cis-trans isomerase [Candidatus Gastranaerophilales bacterium]|nr:peptidyl-prolyl cis-trans isomerase [Candidatus Gastranaerophilales bacterium]